MALEDAGDPVDLGQVEAEEQAVGHQGPFRPKNRAILPPSDAGSSAA